MPSLYWWTCFSTCIGRQMCWQHKGINITLSVSVPFCIACWHCFTILHMTWEYAFQNLYGTQFQDHPTIFSHKYFLVKKMMINESCHFIKIISLDSVIKSLGEAPPSGVGLLKPKISKDTEVAFPYRTVGFLVFYIVQTTQSFGQRFQTKFFFSIPIS